MEQTKNNSENCESCALFKNCKNQEPGNLRPILDYRYETKDTNTLLVVADYTDLKDDEKGTYFNSDERAYTTVVNTILSSLKCKYVFTTALACGVSRGTTLNKKHYNACFQEKLKPLILKHKPRAIVCLGKQAMDAVLQNQSPKTMKEIEKTGINVEWQQDEIKELNSLVLAVEHPVRFFNEKVDKVRLQSLYKLVFNKAEKYCLETDVRKPVDFELITTPARFYQVAGMPFKEMAFDIENRHSKKDLTRNIIWKCNANILSLAFTYYCEKSKDYKNYVVVGEALKDKLCLEKLFTDRIVSAHNGKHDIQTIYRQLGVDIWKFIREYNDTLALFYLTNQNRVNNGLKDLSAQYLGIYDYADEVKRYEIEANIRLKEFRKQAIDNYKDKQQDYKKYCEALTWKEVGNKITSIKAKSYEAILSKYSSHEEIEKLLALCKKAVDELPPEGSCDYGDLPISVLAQYNAEDTYCTLKLKREILPYLSKYEKGREKEGDPLWDETAYDLFRKSIKMICYVERNGLPMDMESLQEMKRDLEETELKVRKELLEVKVIKDVLLELENISTKEEKGTLTEEDLLKEVSPTKAKFITALCEKLGLQDFALLTKSNNYSYTSKKCINNIRDHFKDDADNQELYKIFNAFSYVGNNRQVRSKFIGNWEQYWVPETGRFHSNFLLTKNQSLVYANKEADGGAQSGRLSNTQINTQQIRKVGYLRKHFKAPPGYVFVEVDYASLEPVLLSFVSGCERLKEVFRRKLDIYRVTANDIYDFGVDFSKSDKKVKEQLKENVDEVFRDKLKVGFLAWCYGRGIPSFMRDMKITEEEAKDFYRKAREMYSEIYDWKEGIISDIETGRMVHTMFGRKRDFPLMPPRKWDKEDRKRYNKELAKAIRVGVNFPIQSLGSDICLWQAARLQDWIQKEYLEDVIQLVNLVHDAVWFLVKETQVDWAIKEIQNIMEDTSALPFGMDVPLRTEAEYGPTLASYLKKNKELHLPYNG